MLNNSNNGMFLETIIKQTANYYQKKLICLIFKRNIPIKIIKKYNSQIYAKIINHAQSDYYGVYNGYYFDFEAKQTNKDYFLLANLKPHQKTHLNEIYKFNGKSFLLIYFSKYDEYFAIQINLIDTLRTKITRDWCLKNAFSLNIFFPGIIDIVEYLNHNI